MYKIYKLERIRDGEGWPAGTIIYAHARCKGWRVIGWFWDSHSGGGLR